MTGRQWLPARSRRMLWIDWVFSLICLTSVVGRASAQNVQAPPRPPVPSPVQAAGSGADPIVAEVDLQRGLLDLQKGRYDDALKRFDKVGETIPSASYYRGLSLLGLKRPDEALQSFETSRSGRGAPLEANLGVGISQLSRGDDVKANAALDTYLQARPNDLYGHYLIGVALFRQGRADEARTHFKTAAADSSLSPYLDPYQRFMQSVDDETSLPPLPSTTPVVADDDSSFRPRTGFLSRMTSQPGGPGTIPGPGMTGVDGTQTGAGDPDRRYNLALLNGYEFDTNPSLAPGISATGLGSLNRREDSRYVIASFGEYRFVQNPNQVVGLIGSTYDTFQFRLPQFNVQDYMGGVYANQGFGKFILGGRYEFHDTLLAGKQFTTDHRLTPNFTFREGSFGHFTAFYEYEALDVNGFALIPAQRRTGNINAVGATQAIYLFDGNGRLYLNYRYENAMTQGSDFDRSTNQISARLEVPLPGKMVFNTEFRQFFDDYKNPNSLDFLGRPRVDRRIEARAGIQKFLTSHLSLRLEYIYTNNQSNTENLFGTSFYSYHRNVLSTLLVYDF